MKDNLEKFFTTWGILIVINQVLLFGSCFSFYCLIAALPHTGVIAFFITKAVMSEDKKTNKPKRPRPSSPKNESNLSVSEEKPSKEPQAATPNHRSRQRRTASTSPKTAPIADYFKQKGDIYEKHIGSQFEKKGDLVIYNGFIRGYEDKGVDVIGVSLETKTINLIQCKNWTQKPMLFEDIEDIYFKLSSYDLDFVELNTTLINQYLQVKQTETHINYIFSEVKFAKQAFTIRKTLYIASDKVIDLNIGKHLTMIKPNIFRYQDMKIVFEKR